MANGYRVILDLQPGANASATSLSAGSCAADRALSAFDAAWMKRLQPLASKRREDLLGFDYLDASALEYALYKALEAAFPETDGEPPKPLSRNSFVLRIVESLL